ncbi:phosphoribosylanthranilate isomerase [Salinicoccus albus]|uniref:phosphoribosylanthranilate isomerase n=1 Tax=Salinicoccus albus TaxID=418756 RepID=UPI00035CEDCD|nr:phosphoribosylanthranilate isomerase [Salinicoccus albus]
MKVKICGIQSIQAAQAAEENGADMVGFMFADSSRKITPETAEAITDALGSGIQKTGVFVNTGLSEINRTIDQAGLDYVQLHGDESPAFARAVNSKVIKAFSIDEGPTFKEMFEYPADFILLDSRTETKRGGTGRKFDWSKAVNTDIDRRRLILAGGLNAGNINQAEMEVAPFMIDLSSGAETNGVKDRNKIAEIMQIAKGVVMNGKDIPAAR